MQSRATGKAVSTITACESGPIIIGKPVLNFFEVPNESGSEEIQSNLDRDSSERGRFTGPKANPKSEKSVPLTEEESIVRPLNLCNQDTFSDALTAELGEMFRRL